MVLYDHMRCDIDFRLRLAVHLSSLTSAAVKQLAASCWVFWGYLLSILLYEIRPYLLVSLLIIGILWYYTFIWLLLLYFFAILILRTRNPWRCKTWISENRFFVTLAVVWCISRGSVGATSVRQHRGRCFTVVELWLVANYLSGHTWEWSLLISH